MPKSNDFVAQLERASAYEAEGCGFESLQNHMFFRKET